MWFNLDVGADRRFVEQLEDFRRDRSRALASAHVVFWYPHPGLRIVSGFGQVRIDDMQLLVSAMRDELQPGFAPFKSLVELSELDGVDPDGFALLVEFMREHADAFSKVNERSAYVHGSGNPVATAAVAGYAKVAGARFPTSSHETLEEGLAALDLETDMARVVEDLGALKADVRSAFELLTPLEEAIRADLTDASAERIGKALGMSTRTLQRRLGEIDTTLTDELRRVRVRVARERLLAGESITAAAHDVGFTTQKAFREAFKRELGMTPSEWRDANVHS